MQFITIVPLGLAILWVVFKFLAIGVLLIIGLIIWGIYVAFFKKEKEPEDERNPEAEFWDKMMEKQEKDDAEFYRNIGRLEQQLDDIEERVGRKPKRRKNK